MLLLLSKVMYNQISAFIDPGIIDTLYNVYIYSNALIESIRTFELSIASFMLMGLYSIINISISCS